MNGPLDEMPVRSRRICQTGLFLAFDGVAVRNTGYWERALVCYLSSGLRERRAGLDGTGFKIHVGWIDTSLARRWWSFCLWCGFPWACSRGSISPKSLLGCLIVLLGLFLDLLPL